MSDSVWYAVDEDGDEYFYEEKPERNEEGGWWDGVYLSPSLLEVGWPIDLPRITWKDEPVRGRLGLVFVVDEEPKK